MGRYDALTSVYDTFVYDQETTDALIYALQIDWDNDGIFDGRNDAENMIEFTIDRGRSFFLNASGNGFQEVTPGRAVFLLDNSSGDYDAFSTDSPLYPYVLPGRDLSFYVKTGTTTDSAQYQIFTGKIEDIRPVTTQTDEKVRIVAVDKLADYTSRYITIDLQKDITMSDAVTLVLAEAGDTDVNVDSVLDDIDYYFGYNKSVRSSLNELVTASLGNFFIGVDGKPNYYSRVRPVQTMTEIDQSQIMREMSFNQPWDTVRNYISYEVNPRVLQSQAILWTLQSVPSVLAGASLTLWGQYTYDNINVPADNVISPLPTTDYLMNTQADGGGLDLTSDFSITASIFAEAIKLVITNNSTSTGYITYFQVRGDAVSKPNGVGVIREDAASQAAYGLRAFQVDSEWLQNVNTADDIAATCLDLLKDPRKLPTIKIIDRPDLQFGLELFDRVNLTIAKKGVNDAYRVGKIYHRTVSETCQHVETELTLEPFRQYAAGVWIFPVQMGITTVFG